MLIALPCSIGMCIYAQPILNLLFPNANQGAGILQISSIAVLFTILDQTINGALQGFGKVKVPAIALGCGVITKLILNLILIRIPSINVYGAAIGSVACHVVAFSIAMTVLKKNIKLNLTFNKFVLKPVIATTIMGVCSYFIYIVLNNSIFSGNKATIITIISAVIIYGIALLALRILNKEEIYMLPQGTKIYRFLLKTGIYKEKNAEK